MNCTCAQAGMLAIYGFIIALTINMGIHTLDEGYTLYK